MKKPFGCTMLGGCTVAARAAPTARLHPKLHAQTLIVKGSHRCPRDDEPPRLQYEHATQAVMPKGSVCLFTGSTLHAGGANRTSGRRVGMLIGYLLRAISMSTYPHSF